MVMKSLRKGLERHHHIICLLNSHEDSQTLKLDFLRAFCFRTPESAQRLAFFPWYIRFDRGCLYNLQYDVPSSMSRAVLARYFLPSMTMVQRPSSSYSLIFLLPAATLFSNSIIHSVILSSGYHSLTTYPVGYYIRFTIT